MSKFSKLKPILLSACLVPVFGLNVFASGNFNNNLLKTDIKKNSQGGLNIVLSTKKAYTDKVIVNKKDDCNYVILLPETANSQTSKPDLSKVSDVVSAISVKTQQYQGNIKGYTKLTINTKKPITISAQTKLIDKTDVKAGEKDLQELIAQSKKVKSSVKKSSKPSPKIIVNKTVVKTKKQNTPKVLVNNEKKVPKVITIKKEPIVSYKPNPEPKPETNIENKGIEIVNETQMPTVENANTETQNLETKVSQTETTNPTPIEPTVSTSDKLLKDALIIIRNNIYLFASSALLCFLLLLMIARKITKASKKTKAQFNEHLNDQPVEPVNYEEKIDENMDWKEKFDTYKEVAQNSEQQNEVEVPQNEELDELFNTQTPQEVTQDEDYSLMYEVQNETNQSVNTIQEETENQQPQNTDDIEEITPEDLFSDEDEMSDLQIIENEGLENLTQQDITEEPVYIEKEIVSKPLQKTKDNTVFEIDESTGFKLNIEEEKTELIGYTNGKDFIIKSIENLSKPKLQARFNEKTPNGATYMIRVGTFRGVVEVGSDIKLLIEL